MVYCTKCGTKNKEDAKYCSKCGANLEVSPEKRLEKRAEEWGEEFGRRAEEWGEQLGKRAEEECFGLPHGGAIAGMVFGIIILIFGFSLLTGIDIRSNIFFIIVIIFGTLIVAGSIYTLTRR